MWDLDSSHSTPGVLVGRIGLAGSDIDLARHSLVDDDLLLLLQQFDQPFLGPDVAPDVPVSVVEEAGDGSLFGKGWKGNGFTKAKMTPSRFCTFQSFV